MLKGLGSLGSILKGAQEMRTQMERIQGELRQMRVEGSGGGGMVTVKMNGQQELVSCRIDPEVLVQQDNEMLEELIVAAVNQALEKSRALASEEMGKVVGGLQIPGLTDAIQNFMPSNPAS